MLVEGANPGFQTGHRIPEAERGSRAPTRYLVAHGLQNPRMSARAPATLTEEPHTSATEATKPSQKSERRHATPQLRPVPAQSRPAEPPACHCPPTQPLRGGPSPDLR